MSAKGVFEKAEKMLADWHEQIRQPLSLEEFQRLYICEWKWPEKPEPSFTRQTRKEDRHKLDWVLDDYGLLARPFPPVAARTPGYLGNCKVQHNPIGSDQFGWYMPRSSPSREDLSKHANIDAYYHDVVKIMAYAKGLPEYSKDFNTTWDMALGSFFEPCMALVRNQPFTIGYENRFGMHAVVLPNIQIERFNVKLYFAYCEEGYVTAYMMHEGRKFYRRGIHYQNQVVLDRVLTLGRLLKE
jgi:hypothetical protein